MWAILALALAAAPQGKSALYAFELDGVPVGAVQLSLVGGRYVYRSQQFFTRYGQRRSLTRSASFEVDGQHRLRGAKAVPESLWLWLPRPAGCVTARDELAGTEGELCVRRPAADRATGQVFGENFEASYGDGELLWLRLGDGRFVRLAQPGAQPAPPDLFAEGFPIEGKDGVLELRSPRPRNARGGTSRWEEAPARALAREVHEWLEARADDSAEGRCLLAAKEFAARARGRGQLAAVVIGVLEDGGRAYPHAWVRIGLPGEAELELDPSSLEPVSARTHLALASGGRDLLDLLTGRARILRKFLPPWDAGADAP